MKFLYYTGLFLSLMFSANSFALEQQYQQPIVDLIKAFKNHDKAAISSHIRYPLSRTYPVPDINNEAELVERFDDVFDETLIKQIVDSNIDTDWDKVGWRGIMLNSGVVWVDTDGKIIGINYQTAKEQLLAKNLIAADKQALHPSINAFVEPILDWQTAKYRIRIDDLGDGNFRYASWSNDKKTSDKPDIVLLKGEIEFEGSGGNHSYTFKNGRYSYVLQVTVIGCDTSPPGWLEVYKDGKRILSQDIINTGS
ncbi:MULTISPECIES: hypothetical protein [Pseudoalteromonas]|uniref:hypothetical protein n=1 Tax=Pseudoalteromonas TaxID=53246 RepID=UPI0012307259|nr:MULTISPECIES: hypothetical protein [Pseudoalteromonas]MBB1335722.1 hypothetical protein [Pseudoalteromonas sp. SR41-6]MBB1344021.1 hypothetical protein [Pseudoalteromonas sp. SR45-6]MBB1461288.1 hypothetical protein [Pseudoalteromonas sp. SG41-8]